jgi:hypothetical protein
MAMAGYIALGVLSGDALSVKAKYVRQVGLLGLVIFTTIALGGISLLAERSYLVNGATYARWLASGIVADTSMDTVIKLRKSQCQAEPIEVIDKPDGSQVLRCGWTWISGKTYLRLPTDSAANKSN